MTSDNRRLSLVTLPAIFETSVDITLSQSARKYLLHSASERTRRAYRSDFAHFAAFCHSQKKVPALPAAPVTVAAYLVMLAESGFRPSTLLRRLAAISKAHSAIHLDSPASRKHVIVKEVWSGIRRTLGMAQMVKAPATTHYLKQMLTHVPDTLSGLRDRALLLLGFAGALRRSELVALTVADVSYVPEGLVVLIRSSKTDQDGSGQKVAIALGGTRQTCPISCLRAWLLKGGITTGPLFPSINRWGDVQAKAVSGQVVSLQVKKYARLAGLDATLFSGHSLRAGLATSAAQAGATRANDYEADQTQE